MLCQMWWLAETVSNCLSAPVCQSCPSLIPAPSSLVLLLRLLIIFSLRTNYFQWWTCHIGALARKNILPWEEHTANWHVFPLFGWEKNERGIRVLSFVLWYFYKFKTMSTSCHNSLKSKLTWNVTLWKYIPDCINCKRMDTRTYSLMYTL